MSFDPTPTQRLTMQVATVVRMKCNVGYMLKLDSAAEDMQTPEGRKNGYRTLSELHQSMKEEDGFPANV